MKTFNVTTNGHQIKIALSIWSGKERIHYDDRVVSEKWSFQLLTPHSFRVQEGGEEVTYEVNVLTGFGYGHIVRRNGIIVAHQP